MALSRELAELDPVVARDPRLSAAAENLAGLDGAHRAIPRTDAEMRALAEDERPSRRGGARRRRRSDLQLLLLPKDEADEKSAILEVRAGTGGDEAALFAGDLFRMYARYAELKGWKVEIVSESEGTAGGYKEIVAEIKGRGVFARLKFESGVHRVQRVPDTETQGRIHTSAATVAVLPEAEEVDIAINDAGPEDRHHARQRRRRPARQQDRIGRSASPTCRAASWSSCRRSAPSTRTRPRAMALLRARLYDAERTAQGQRARRRPRARRSARATAPSASAPTTSRRAG